MRSQWRDVYYLNERHAVVIHVHSICIQKYDESNISTCYCHTEKSSEEESKKDKQPGKDSHPRRVFVVHIVKSITFLDFFEDDVAHVNLEIVDAK